MTPTIPTIAKEAPPFRIEPDGTIRIGSSRITLDLVVQAYLGGTSPETFVQQHDTVELPEIYATISYYLAHKQDLEPYLQERERRGQEMLERSKSDPRNQGMREKLLARARARA